jgi:hypothetical protein
MMESESTGIRGGTREVASAAGLVKTLLRGLFGRRQPGFPQRRGDRPRGALLGSGWRLVDESGRS